MLATVRHTTRRASNVPQGVECDRRQCACTQEDVGVTRIDRCRLSSARTMPIINDS